MRAASMGRISARPSITAIAGITAIVAIVAMTNACSSGDGGGRSLSARPFGRPSTGSPAGGVDQGDGIDPGSAVDLGSGAEPNLAAGEDPPCLSSADCPSGLCAVSRDPIEGNVVGVGRCLVLCALPQIGAGSTGVDAQPCLRGETCVRVQTIGVCMRPCENASDCTSGWSCELLDDQQPFLGRACAPPSFATQ